MKKVIFIIVPFMLILFAIGCATTPEQRKASYNLSEDVGHRPFVGSPNNLDARGLMKASWW